MKKLLLGLLVCFALVPLTFGQEATPTIESPLTPNPPYSTWSGNFNIQTGISFVWPRATPFAGGAVVGTLLPNQVLQAIQPPSGSAQAYEAAFAQWWGYFTANGITGWIELANVTPVVVATPTPNVTAPENWVITSTETVEVQIASGIPFAWIRESAESNSSFKRTVFPGARLILTDVAVNDGSQLWWPVQEVSSGVVGFVEQNSLRYVRRVSKPDASKNPSTWIVGTVVRVKAAVPFSWVRDEAVSSGDIVATLLKGREVIVANGPVSDGVQDWWQIIVPNTPYSGWVEETSLEKVR